MEHVIWRFQTCEGSVRLGLVGPEDSFRAMHDGLIIASAHAASYSEFISEAEQVIAGNGGMLGDILRQSWVVATLQERLREAARVVDPMAMAQFILKAAAEASPANVEALLNHPSNEVYRKLIRDLIPSLDQGAQEFVESLATNLSVSVLSLLDSLELKDT